MSPPRSGGDPGPQGHTIRADDVAGLLAALGCQTPEDLNQMLYSAFDLDPYVAEAAPDHMVVAVRDRGVEVEFPCTPAELWDSVTQLEAEVLQRLEDAPEDG